MAAGKVEVLLVVGEFDVDGGARLVNIKKHVTPRPPRPTTRYIST